MRRHGRSSAAAAALSERELAAPASREISCAKSGREHWAKGLYIERAGCKREVAARCFVAEAAMPCKAWTRFVAAQQHELGGRRVG